MKVFLKSFLAICLLLSIAVPAAGHQPRLISGEQVVEIKKPEVSQAFYATLEGNLHEYQVTALENFNFYLNILVPALPDSRKDFSFVVYELDPDGKRNLLDKVDGAQHEWEPFFEPFAGDRYYKGPEWEKQLPAGTYRVKVSNPDNRGKYVLSVGREERFSAGEVIQMVKDLPALKVFFNKSPFTALFNLVGLFMLIGILFLVAAVIFLHRFLRSRRQT